MSASSSSVSPVTYSVDPTRPSSSAPHHEAELVRELDLGDLLGDLDERARAGALSLMPGPSLTESRWAPAMITLLASPRGTRRSGSPSPRAPRSCLEVHDESSDQRQVSAQLVRHAQRRDVAGVVVAERHRGQAHPGRVSQVVALVEEVIAEASAASALLPFWANVHVRAGSARCCQPGSRRNQPPRTHWSTCCGSELEVNGGHGGGDSSSECGVAMKSVSST